MTRASHRPRRAFTLIELLVVVAVIALLASMILAIVGQVRFRARVLDTTHRIEAVLTALSEYSRAEGSAAQALQEAAALGGVVKFASMDSCASVIATGGGSGSSRFGPPLLVKPDSSGTAWATTGDESYQQQTNWRSVFEARPPLSGPVAATWYEATWPTQWPASDWNQATPGGIPPILRFPWGRPGLTLEGGICDPGRPASDQFGKKTEYKTLSAWQNGDPAGATLVPVPNSWATCGASSDPALTFASSSASETAPVLSPVTGKRSDGTSVSVDTNRALPFDLGMLSPLRTVELLMLGGIVEATPGASAYRTDRSPRRPWNDAWGNPLVVAYALFQPERYRRTWDGQNNRHLLLQKAQDAYGYNRSIYLAVAAIGPDRAMLMPRVAQLSVSTTTAGDQAALAPIWAQLARTSGAAAWTEAGFDAAPWRGVKLTKADGLRCFLSTPLELR